MLSPGALISLTTDDPFPITLKETTTVLPSLPFPSQLPASALICSNDCCALGAANADAVNNNAASTTRIDFIFLSPCPAGRLFLLLPSHFFRVLCFHERLQVGQARLPEDAILLQPGINSSQWFWIELVKAVSALSMFIY